MTTCRICKAYMRDESGVKYGVRHYAHFECYLRAGKAITDLHAWQVGAVRTTLIAFSAEQSV